MAIRIIGAGLAGSEAAWQVLGTGLDVELFEMRPVVMTRAHCTGAFAELVCSNSFRGAALNNAVGLLKEELRCLGSLVMETADLTKVPAGGALAVDRKIFSQTIDRRLRSHPRVTVHEIEVTEIPASSAEDPVIIAAGPLVSKSLSASIASLTGQGNLSFYDAISPVILNDSIDHGQIFRASRYGKGEGSDYLNIALSKDEYYGFVRAIENAEKAAPHADVESNSSSLRPFEGCMPIEDMVARGPDVLAFGPLKPAGLIDPKTGKRPFAVVQLRQDDKCGKLWSMVGMQTRMKHDEQRRIFRSLPGLKNAEFVRLGSVHRNTFINSPKCLNSTLEFRSQPGLFFAGQITGVEGYVESTASGLVAGINAARLVLAKPLLCFPKDTAIGSLMHYISDPERSEFQPMNISFGLMESYLSSALRDETGRKIAKKDRRLRVAEQALKVTVTFCQSENLSWQKDK